MHVYMMYVSMMHVYVMYVSMIPWCICYPKSWCMYDAYMYDADIYNPWSWHMCVWCTMYDALMHILTYLDPKPWCMNVWCIYLLPWSLTLKYVCMMYIFSLSVSWTQIPVIEVLRMNTVHSMTCYDLLKMLWSVIMTLWTPVILHDSYEHQSYMISIIPKDLMYDKWSWTIFYCSCMTVVIVTMKHCWS